MSFKILILLVLIIVFPALIAGSTVLLLKSGLVDTSAHSSKSDTKSTETQNTDKENLNDQKRISDVLEYPKYYFTGKIDGKLQVWLVLNGYLDPSSDKSNTSGEIFIEGENSKADIFANFTNPESCIDNCTFNIEIPYYSAGGNPQQKLNSSNPVFNGAWSQKDKQIPLDEIQSLKGIYQPKDSKQKLKFELNRSKEFDIDNYNLRYNIDKTVYIKNSNCFQEIKNYYSFSCDIHDAKTNLIISGLEEWNCETILDGSCYNQFQFGKKINQKQYILLNKGGCLDNLKVLELDSNYEIKKIGTYNSQDCADGNLDDNTIKTKNKEYNNAIQRYSLPKV